MCETTTRPYNTRLRHAALSTFPTTAMGYREAVDPPADELVLVVSRADLVQTAGRGQLWRGICPGDARIYLDLFAASGRFVPRAEAEEDAAWKQVIPYLVLFDRGRIFLMQRTRAGGDRRLHDRWTIGLGGHVAPTDGGVEGGLRREWAEEVSADWELEPTFLGLLNDDSTPVGRVHLGAVFRAEAKGRAVSIREADKLRGSFADGSEVRRVYEHLETWSQLLFDHLGNERGMG
jgi:predicted NUDIX family phosphoesterase